MGSWRILAVIFLVYTIVAFVAGIFDVNYLGDYAEQSPMFATFEVFGLTSATPEVGETATIQWKDITAVVGYIPNCLTWEFSVLTHNTFSNTIRWVILLPLSAALLISFGLMLWTHVPILGRGSQA